PEGPWTNSGLGLPSSTSARAAAHARALLSPRRKRAKVCRGLGVRSGTGSGDAAVATETVTGYARPAASARAAWIGARKGRSTRSRLADSGARSAGSRPAQPGRSGATHVTKSRSPTRSRRVARARVHTPGPSPAAAVTGARLDQQLWRARSRTGPGR